ncbi:hypothetical protein [Nocardioides coralli]|uniref:hypothetical protein n=1 Tax=Nocardioides coralli TaxID=2872154 RepID=UPI001CA3DEBE|nr:hypothetical protein [Nocardioides coralli]QZY28556.1 hypothetical protein K6T13_13965 [Nocardioides coralli]
MKRARRLGALAAALMVLTSCGGGEEVSGPAEPPSRTGADASPTDEPTDDPTPTVEAAAGEVMTTESAYARAPEGWRTERQLDGVLDSWVANKRGTLHQIYLSDLGAVGSEDLEQLVRTDGLTGFEGRPRVSYDADLGGEAAFRAAGDGVVGPREEYGAIRGGVGVKLTFEFDESFSAGQRRAVVDAVLASFRWS